MDSVQNIQSLCNKNIETQPKQIQVDGGKNTKDRKQDVVHFALKLLNLHHKVNIELLSIFTYFCNTGVCDGSITFVKLCLCFPQYTVLCVLRVLAVTLFLLRRNLWDFIRSQYNFHSSFGIDIFPRLRYILIITIQWMETSMRFWRPRMSIIWKNEFFIGVFFDAELCFLCNSRSKCSS